MKRVETATASRLNFRRVVASLLCVGALLGGWAISLSEEEFLCDTGTTGVRLELYERRIVGWQRAVVLTDPGSELLPGVPSRYEISSDDEAKVLGVVLSAPGSPRVDIFSAAFREQNCRLQK